MPVSIDEIFRRGGRELVDLLEYLVISFHMDPVFLFLTGEYRDQPTAYRAVALYDVFCAPRAEARVSAVASIPQRDLRLQREIERLRAARERATGPHSDHSGPAPGPPLMAPRYLFDAVVNELADTAAEEPLAAILGHYDPERSPHENLPSGRMSAGQRAFVEQVWEPKLRPYLVAAGFRRIANIA